MTAEGAARPELIFVADPEILRFQRVLQDVVMAHLLRTRGPDFLRMYQPELSGDGHLVDPSGKVAPVRPSHLIRDLETYRDFERKTRDVMKAV